MISPRPMTTRHDICNLARSSADVCALVSGRIDHEQPDGDGDGTADAEHKATLSAHFVSEAGPAHLVTRMKIFPRSRPNFSLAASEADVEQAGYSPPTPTPAIPRATVKHPQHTFNRVAAGGRRERHTNDDQDSRADHGGLTADVIADEADADLTDDLTDEQRDARSCLDFRRVLRRIQDALLVSDVLPCQDSRSRR